MGAARTALERVGDSTGRAGAGKGGLYQQGCFGPCLCPVLISEPVQETFVVTATGIDGLFTTYAVTDINWMVSIGETDTFVTGSGTYKIGGEFANGAVCHDTVIDLHAAPRKTVFRFSERTDGDAP